MAMEKALEILETLSVDEVKDTRNLAEVSKAIRTSLMSKQVNLQDIVNHIKLLNKL